MLRTATRALQIIVDLAILSAAYWLAYLLRFDGHPPLQMVKRLMFTWPYVVGLEYLVLSLFAVPRFAWRYVGLREVARVLWATSAATAVLLAVRIVSGVYVARWGYLQYALVPAGVIVVNFALGFLGVAGVRVLRRIEAERSANHRLAASERPELVPTLLIGAGRGGVMVAREIAGRPDLGIVPVGFLDDDAAKAGTIIHGITVLGSISELAKFAKRTEAQQALLTIANAPRTVTRRIVQACERAGLPTKVVPGLYQILEGKVSLTRIRPVSIEDLLGREAVKLDTERIGEFLTGRRVVVTGAGGSIGSEICRQVARHAPARLVLVERSEYALFRIHEELKGAFPALELTPSICDVCDGARVDAVFTEHAPEVVFHAAAYKHVPMMELNPGEALKNNVFGTKVVADAARNHAARAFVLISTDKAVNPSSIMGATKRIGEKYIQALSNGSGTKYLAVRFGNVLGSTGSVIPIFKRQIAAGGPVTVTHPEMKRYFMTIPEASQLVLEASAMGEGGEIFVLDMGEPVKIADLAEELIRLSGFTPGADIKIEFTGVRPGEKLFEELGFDAEQMSKTAHPSIYIGKLAPATLAEVTTAIDALHALVGETSVATVRSALRRLVPEILPDGEIPVSKRADAPATPETPERVSVLTPISQA